MIYKVFKVDKGEGDTMETGGKTEKEKYDDFGRDVLGIPNYCNHMAITFKTKKSKQECMAGSEVLCSCPYAFRRGRGAIGNIGCRLNIPLACEERSKFTNKEGCTTYFCFGVGANLDGCPHRKEVHELTWACRLHDKHKLGELSSKLAE